jgi:hypothetical protein
VALNATQHESTITGGQKNGGSVNSNYTNANADNPALAYGPTTILNQLLTADATSLGITQAQVNLSNPAILLQDADLNICSGLADYALTNKIFINLNYAWQDSECGPYLGGGVDVEWASSSCATLSNHINSGISQWALWVKGGISF